MNTNNPFEMMKQLGQLKGQMESMQEEMKKMSATGSAGGGMVNVSISGDFNVKKVEIAEEVYALNDKSMLEMLVASAFNDAVQKLQVELQDRSRRLASSYGINV